MQSFEAGGGWDTFERMLQPQNNIFGAISLSLEELDKQKEVEKEADINEALSGSGYLGQKQCLSRGPSNQCVVWGPSTIPSGLTVATLAALINRNLAFLSDISRRDPATINSELSRISEYFSNSGTGLIPRIFGFQGFSGGPGPAPAPPGPAPQPPPGPGPNPAPPPAPPPTGGQPASLLADVQAERAKYGPAPSDEELGRMLNAIAWKNRQSGWGLSRKTFGERCPSPVGEIACDILHHQPTNLLFDVFVAAGSGGSATPAWQNVPYHNNSNRPWVAPVQP